MISKKEIYIPIEIKPREFVSQLFLSGELANMGLRVYLGSKYAIDQLVENKNNKGGVYLYKGGGGSINKFRKVSKYVSSIAVLDQEISPKRDYERVIKNRFVKGCLKYVSRLYYIGPEAQKAAINVLEDVKAYQVKAFGWPRVDLWRPELHHVWGCQIKEIKKRFPEPYLLFTSDFGSNTNRLLEGRNIALEKRGRKKTKNDINKFRDENTKNYKKYIEFIDFLELVNKDKNIPTIIIRPHPGEDHSDWKEKVKNFSKIHIVYEGDVSPWLLASEGLLHRGCTSAIEATFAKKKSAFLTNFSTLSLHSVTNNISPSITDIESLKDWILTKNDPPFNKPEISELLQKHIAFSKATAASKIAEDLFSLSDKFVNPSHINKKFSKRNIVINFFGKVFSRIYKKPNYLPKLPRKNKMQDGIKLSECKYFLSLMYPKQIYRIDEPDCDLIMLEKFD